MFLQEWNETDSISKKNEKHNQSFQTEYFLTNFVSSLSSPEAASRFSHCG